MGYFRLFYYIAYIFNTVIRILKRYGKKILWITAIFVFLCLCMYNPKSSAIYMGDYSYGDPNYALMQYYDDTAMDFVRRFDSISKVPSYNNICNQLKSYITSGDYSIFLYFGNLSGFSQVNGQVYHERNLRVYIYRNNFTQFSSITPTAYDDYLGINPLNIVTVSSSEYYIFNFAGEILVIDESYQTSQSTREVYIPSTLVNYMNEYIYEYFFNNVSLETLEVMRSMDEKLGNIENTLVESPVENSITSDMIPEDSGVTDTTETDLNGIFGSIAEAFTDIPRSKYNITVNIPFTEKSFVIPYNLTSSALSGSSFEWLTTFIGAVWYYIVARYILIDIINKFEHIQSGNIENMENDNIKEDLL